MVEVSDGKGEFRNKNIKEKREPTTNHDIKMVGRPPPARPTPSLPGLRFNQNKGIYKKEDLDFDSCLAFKGF